MSSPALASRVGILEWGKLESPCAGHVLGHSEIYDGILGKLYDSGARPPGLTWRGRTLACAWRMRRYVQYFDASSHKYLWYLDGWTQVPSCETLDYYGTMAQTDSPARNLLCPSLLRRPSGKPSTIHCLPDSIHFA